MAHSPRFTEEQLICFAEAVVGDLRTPMVVVDGRLRIVAASEPFSRLLSTSGDPRGQELLALDQRRWDVPELRQALEKALPRGRSFDDIQVPESGENMLFVSGRALHTDAGQPELVVLSFEQAQSQERTETAVDEQRLAEEIVATVREPLLVLDYDYRIRLANQSFYRDFRVSPDEVVGRPLSEIGSGQWDIPELRKQLDTILKQDGYFNDFEVEHAFDRIGRRTMLLNARRIDHLRLILLAIEDVTERRRQERQMKELVSELAHRIKNMLAVVQSLAKQTTAGSIEEFRSSLLGRLNALATAHNVLLETQWQKAELDELLRQIVAPHTQDDSDRIRIEGPPVTLSADQATAFAFIVSELTANAAKYGALSRASGEVSVAWGWAQDKLWLTWQESGGPVVRSSPTGGFGTTLIERTASYQLGGNAELRFEPTGLVCALEVPLAQQEMP